MGLNDMLGLMDMMNSGGGSTGIPGLGSLPGVGSMLQFGGFMSAIFVIAIIVIIVAMWTKTAFKWLYIGRKAGLDKDWMPFVPFAKAIYRLKIVDESWWKMFFLEGWWFYGGILNLIINAISANQWATFSQIVYVLYVLCCIAYNIYWRYKYYNAFNVRPHMAIGILIPFSGGRRRSLDYLIAFTETINYTGVGTYQTIRGTANNIVDVPKGGHASGGGQIGQTPHSTEPAIMGLSGMYAGQKIPLAPNEELLIGRDNAMCNLILDQNADKISRKHCSIVFDAMRNVYMVTDYSSNGTYIDGGNRFVANMATQVQRGTVISLGNRENRFRLQ